MNKFLSVITLVFFSVKLFAASPTSAGTNIWTGSNSFPSPVTLSDGFRAASIKDGTNIADAEILAKAIGLTNSISAPVNVYTLLKILITGTSTNTGTYAYNTNVGTGSTAVLYFTNVSNPSLTLVYTNASARRSWNLTDGGGLEFTLAQSAILNSVTVSNLTVTLPNNQGTNFTAVNGSGTAFWFAYTNSISTTNITQASFFPVERMVYCHTNGSFDFMGANYLLTNSTSCGLAEAYLLFPNYPEKLDAGVFPVGNGGAILSPCMKGAGKTYTSIVYFGTKDDFNADGLFSCFTINYGGGAPSVSNPYNNTSYMDVSGICFASNTNAPITVLTINGLSSTGTIHDNWFTCWPLATNGCQGFTPVDCNGSGKNDLLGLFVNSSGSDDMAVDHNSFTHVLGMTYEADHGTITYNTMDFCQINSGNSWPTNSYLSIGARINILAPINGNSQIDVRNNWLLGNGFNYFIDNAASPQFKIVSVNDGGEGNPDTMVLMTTNHFINTSWTMMNPYYNSAGFSGYYCSTDNFSIKVKIPTQGLQVGSSIYSFNVFQAPTNFSGTVSSYSTNATLISATSLVVSFTPFTDLSENYTVTAPNDLVGATVTARTPTNFTLGFTAATLTSQTIEGAVIHR